MPPKALSIEDIQDEDLYGFLDIDEKADNKKIDSAYRKLARKWHPDKNPDNRDAPELFRKLVKVAELLKDKEARAAYDQLRRGRRLQKERLDNLNVERRKLREDLERREAAYTDSVMTERQARESLAAKIRRLQEEGAQLVRATEQKLRDEWAQTMAQEATSAADCGNGAGPAVHAVKVRWEKSMGLTEDDIRQRLSKFGALGVVVMSRKGGRALVEFDSPSSARLAADAGSPDLAITLQSPEKPAQARTNSPVVTAAPSPAAAAAPHSPQPTAAAAFPPAKRKMTEKEVFDMMLQAQKAKDQSTHSQ